MYLHVSSSISNFKQKIERRFGLQWWNWYYPFGYTVFIGLYHPIDYLKFIWHRGGRGVFWCGGDIINLRNSWWKFIIPRVSARHTCENEVEQNALKLMGIEAEIHPMLFDDPFQFHPCFKPPKGYTHVFLCAHEKREEEYGVDTVLKICYKLPRVIFHIYGINGRNKRNVFYHGKVSNSLFNKQIRNYHACLRLNTWDGFGEGVAKSILLGQYPITTIPYPLIAHAPDENSLILHLKSLKHKTVSNPAEKYWRKVLCER